MILPHIHILLCTKDGGAFIGPQLHSIVTQTHPAWSLWISDDGSSDETLTCVQNFIAAHPDRDIRLIEGPRQGSAQNFMTLLARPELDGAWIAFADQDDVWMPHKLTRAVDVIWRGTGAEIYASRSIDTDANLKVLGMSPVYHRPFEFGNALVQNVLRGNTIVMPPVVTDFLRSTLPFSLPAKVPFHDWWVYQMVSGAGFDVLHDAKPGIFYRQHDGNLLGSHRTHVFSRGGALLKRVFAHWIDRNLNALHDLTPVLTARSRRLLFDFSDWRAEPLTARRTTPQALGVYRQSQGGDMVLRALARLGKL